SFPVAAITVSRMVFMNIVLFFPATPQTTVQEMNYTVVILGVFMSLAIICPIYGGVHWINGPVSDLVSADKGQDGNLVPEKMEQK
ncbi:hypothetical protein DFH29DRAFT_761485, partial [Suillus ampliporus]